MALPRKKFVLLMGLFTTIAILAFAIYIYYSYGVEGLWLTFFGVFLFIMFLLWMSSEADKKQPRRDHSLDELEEKRAYHRRKGELKAEEEMNEPKQKPKKKQNPFDILRKI